MSFVPSIITWSFENNRFWIIKTTFVCWLSDVNFGSKGFRFSKINWGLSVVYLWISAWITSATYFCHVFRLKFKHNSQILCLVFLNFKKKISKWKSSKKTQIKTFTANFRASLKDNSACLSTFGWQSSFPLFVDEFIQHINTDLIHWKKNNRLYLAKKWLKKKSFQSNYLIKIHPDLIVLICIFTFEQLKSHCEMKNGRHKVGESHCSVSSHVPKKKQQNSESIKMCC